MAGQHSPGSACVQVRGVELWRSCPSSVAVDGWWTSGAVAEQPFSTGKAVAGPPPPCGQPLLTHRFPGTRVAGPPPPRGQSLLTHRCPGGRSASQIQPIRSARGECGALLVLVPGDVPVAVAVAG